MKFSNFPVTLTRRDARTMIIQKEKNVGGFNDPVSPIHVTQ